MDDKEKDKDKKDAPEVVTLDVHNIIVKVEKPKPSTGGKQNG